LQTGQGSRESTASPSSSEVYLRIPVDFGDGDGTTLSLFFLRGREDGPVFHLLAGQHGNELNGCAAVDVFIEELDLSELKGTVLAVPVANPVCVAQGVSIQISTTACRRI